MNSTLDTMLEDVIRVTTEILAGQMIIKETAQKLKAENEHLVRKSSELQQILATSQKQLQAETCIPILMINKLVEEVNHIRKDQGVKIEKLISAMDETNKQFRLMKTSVD